MGFDAKEDAGTNNSRTWVLLYRTVPYQVYSYSNFVTNDCLLHLEPRSFLPALKPFECCTVQKPKSDSESKRFLPPTGVQSTRGLHVIIGFIVVAGRAD